MEKTLKISTLKSLVNIYNKYHNTKYDKHELFCNHCNNWLPVACFTNSLDVRICPLCVPKMAKPEQYWKIISPHKNNYPCKYHANGCNVFAEDIFTHEQTCKMTCFCNIALTKASVIPHLKEQHSMQTIQLEKPMVSFQIKVGKNNACTTATNLPLHLSMGYTSLIVIVSYEGMIFNSNQFDVIVSNITEIPRKMSYKATLIYNGIEHSKYDTVYDQFISNYKKNPIYIPNVQDTVTLNIYFENYEAIQPLLEYFDTVIKDYECPICMEIITDNCYQCTNGHNICGECKSIIGRCPTCRTTFYANIISIKRLTPNFLKPCKNAVNGCFIYGKGSELVDHERNCLMRQITCEICTTDFDRNGYIVHMIRQHGMKKLDKTPTTIEPGFIFYKKHMFEFIIKNQLIENWSSITLYEWSLRLVYSFDTNCAEHFEMQIAYGDITTTAKGTFSKNLYQSVFCVDKAEFPIFTLTFLF